MVVHLMGIHLMAVYLMAVYLTGVHLINLVQRSDQQSVNDSPARRSGVSLAGLLNAIDGVDSPEGRVQIISTNHPERLDKALTRPGRIDLSFHFRLATKDQMEEIFIRMYDNDEEKPDSSVDEFTKDRDLVELATKFIDELPENTFSPADVQGDVLTKKYPQDASRTASRAWARLLLGGYSQEHTVPGRLFPGAHHS